MITLERSSLYQNKNLIEGFLQKQPRTLSSFSFVSLFAWKDFFDFELNIIDDNLCIFAKDSLGSFMYLPPLGPNISAKTIHECFDIMYAENKGKGVSRIDNVPEEDLTLFDPKIFSYFKKSYEYVYQREDIVSLKGNAFKSKRSSYNHFIKSYRYTFLPFHKSMKGECMLLYDAWVEKRKETHVDPVYQDMLKQNRLVHSLVIDYYKELGVVGRVVCIDGKIKAYSFGFVLNDKTFCVLFEVANLNFKGLSTYIFKEFCDDQEIKKFSYINVMDDFGLENIKTTKLSFHPCQMVSSYAVSKK